MSFQPDPAIIRWRIHLASPPVQVYQLLATDAGRRRFWAEPAIERDGAIDFIFPGCQTWRGKILDRNSPSRFDVEYRAGVIAGWAPVLLALKGAADYGVDLRNHDSGRTWEQGFADN
jgi:hypothetical protein